MKKGIYPIAVGNLTSDWVEQAFGFEVSHTLPC
jgi:hypothetical protein